MDNACVEKIIMPTANCVPGMTLMQSIVDEHTGTVIIAKGQKLTSDNIDKLRNFKHTQVWVKIDDDNSLCDNQMKNYESYKNYAKELKNVFSHKKENEGIELEQFVNLAKTLVNEFKGDYELLKCMSLLPKLQKDIYYHSINIAFLALLVGKWRNYEENQLEEVVLAGLLHDIGKMNINSSLFNKDKDEMLLSEKLEYRRHSIYGYELLVKYNELDIEVLKAVLSHHERIDGSGYPLSLREEKINEYSKIIGIVDTFDRLMEKNHVFDVIKIMTTSMLKKFDAEIVFQFCSNVANYYVGRNVLLNDGEIGEIGFIQTQALHKPVVRVQDEYIDLYEHSSIEIAKVL